MDEAGQSPLQAALDSASPKTFSCSTKLNEASLPRRQVDSGTGEARAGVELTEADAAGTAIAFARAEALERVEYKEEEVGGRGTMQDKQRAREWRALLQKAVLEHGVGRWEAKVRLQCNTQLAL